MWWTADSQSMSKNKLLMLLNVAKAYGLKYPAIEYHQQLCIAHHFDINFNLVAPCNESITMWVMPDTTSH